MLYALLLAGGRSSRMGQDKSRLEFQGKSLLQRSLDLLHAAGADEVLISGEVAGYDSIPDLLPDCGPLGGLHATVHHIDERGKLDDSLLLVIPVDMPLLTVEVLTKLLAVIGDAECSHYAGEVFPCVFRLNTNLRDTLDAMFADGTDLGGKRSMKALLKAFNSDAVTSAFPEQVFKNLNNPQDWQEIMEMSER